MSFAVTKFSAYGLKNTGATRKRGVQRVELTITGLVSDVSYDLGTVGGTFWTSALADPTYGGTARAARDFILTTLTAQVSSLLEGVRSQQLIARQRAASPSGSSYSQTVATVTTPVPELTFAAGNAPVSGVYVLEWLLADGMEPLTASYG